MTDKLITENKRMKAQIDRQAEMIQARNIKIIKAERAIEELKRRLAIAGERVKG
jgi:hypothetical protein